jgi:hypothetical protein
MTELGGWLDEQLSGGEPDDEEVTDEEALEDDDAAEAAADAPVQGPDEEDEGDEAIPTTGREFVAYVRSHNDAEWRALGWQSGDAFLATMVNDHREWDRVSRELGAPASARPTGADLGLPEWAVAGLALGGRMLDHDLGRR